MRTPTILLTGATGHIGRAVLAALLTDRPDARVYVLVRDPTLWAAHARRLGRVASRVTALPGDLTRPGLGLSPLTRTWLSTQLDTIVHAAANTSFAQTLAEGRSINVEGTRRLLELAAERPGPRFVFVGTAFVAGNRTGIVGEDDLAVEPGFLNAYEQSKHEAEALVRAEASDWLILRPSTVVCDDATGVVTQLNAVHRALRIYYRGLAALMPGAHDTPVDMVPTDYVARATAELVLRHREVSCRTLHLCAGRDAIPLGDMLDQACAAWERSVAWRRRSIPRPALTDLATYRLFEETIAATGDARLNRIIQSLSFFIPQLAYPKVFDTAGADAILRTRPPAVREYWPKLIDRLTHTRWGRDPAAPGLAAEVA
jgi:thioester reductase-like protein